MVLWAVIVNGRQGALWRRAVGVYGGHIGLLEVITVSGRQGALWGSMGVLAGGRYGGWPPGGAVPVWEGPIGVYGAL